MSNCTIPRRTKPVFKLTAIDDQEKFKLLPAPSGSYPYHLNIKSVLPEIDCDKMVFQMAGDTGGFQLPAIKHLVVSEMVKQIDNTEDKINAPAFFFHLGDVVYNFGQSSEYYPQFFEPFKNYPGPVFAIPGNHDADLDLLDNIKTPSLQAFCKVFCSPTPTSLKIAGDSGRLSNIQPNVYWTLETPLANFICLYGNVPRFGTITTEQKEWFSQELITAGKLKNEKAIIVCVHHSAYSADTNHGSSLRMQNFLNSAFEQTGVYPDIVFSGHVHNYQRFTKTYPNGKIVPFVIAGAGGYADLHRIASLNDPDFPDQSTLFNDVILNNYCDDAHGFLQISIEKTTNSFMLNAKYITIEIESEKDSRSAIFDSFSIDLLSKKR